MFELLSFLLIDSSYLYYGIDHIYMYGLDSIMQTIYYIYGLIHIKDMQISMTQKNIEETIKRVLSFVQSVEYYGNGSNLVYVTKKGDLSASDIEGLKAIGLKIRNITSYVYKNQFNAVQSGLQISLELVK